MNKGVRKYLKKIKKRVKNDGKKRERRDNKVKKKETIKNEKKGNTWKR